MAAITQQTEITLSMQDFVNIIFDHVGHNSDFYNLDHVDQIDAFLVLDSDDKMELKISNCNYLTIVATKNGSIDG